MAYKPVSVRPVDIKKEQSKAYEGVYIGKEDTVTPMGPQVIWKFEGLDGSFFSIYGFTTLNMGMKNIKEGTQCRITYTGQEEMMTKKFGKKMVHKCLVEIDVDENATPEEDAPF